MKAYRFAGETKSGRYVEIEVRAKSIEQASMIASVYLVDFAEVV